MKQIYCSRLQVQLRTQTQDDELEPTVCLSFRVHPLDKNDKSSPARHVKDDFFQERNFEP